MVQGYGGMSWFRFLLGVSRPAVFLLVLLGMLAVNVASFAVPGLTSGMSSIAQAVFGGSVVADLGQELTTAKKRLKTTRAELKAKSASLETTRANLKTSGRAKVERLHDRNRAMRGDLETTRNKLGKIRADMDKATRGLARRAVRGAGRNVAAIPMEAIPVVGIATVIAVTALDVSDACATVRDMQDLRVASGIDETPQDWASQVCGTFSGPSVPAVCKMTLGECRDHARSVRTELGDEMGDEIDRHCDALMRP